MNRQAFGILIGIVVLVAVSMVGALIAADAPKPAASMPASGPSDPSAPARAATEILNSKCLACHNHGFDNGEGKPRTGWGSDVPRLIKAGLVKPCNPEGSRIYNVMLAQGGHPGKGNKLTPTSAEVAVVHDWIAAGAADPKAYPAASVRIATSNAAGTGSGSTAGKATSTPATSPAK
jgi:hypothetical protein